MLALPSNISDWLWGIAQAIIGGAATAASSWLGLLAGREAGLAVPTLNLKALGTICITGAVTNLFFFLKQSPIPKHREQTTLTVTKEVTGTESLDSVLHGTGDGTK